MIRTRDLSIPNAAPYQLGHTPKMNGRSNSRPIYQYTTLLAFCQVLLTIKVVDAAVGVEIGSQISVFGHDNKLVCAFYVIYVVTVIRFDLV